MRLQMERVDIPVPEMMKTMSIDTTMKSIENFTHTSQTCYREDAELQPVANELVGNFTGTIAYILVFIPFNHSAHNYNMPPKPQLRDMSGYVLQLALI